MLELLTSQSDLRIQQCYSVKWYLFNVEFIWIFRGGVQFTTEQLHTTNDYITHQPQMKLQSTSASNPAGACMCYYSKKEDRSQWWPITVVLMQWKHNPNTDISSLTHPSLNPLTISDNLCTLHMLLNARTHTLSHASMPDVLTMRHVEVWVLAILHERGTFPATMACRECSCCSKDLWWR